MTHQNLRARHATRYFSLACRQTALAIDMNDENRCAVPFFLPVLGPLGALLFAVMHSPSLFFIVTQLAGRRRYRQVFLDVLRAWN